MSKLWKLSQDVNCGYDVYYGAVVVADTEEEARKVDIGSETFWCKPEFVKVEYLGEAKEGLANGEIVLTDFNAG